MQVLFGSGFLLVLIIAAVMIFLHFVPLGLWISALAANVSVGIFTLVGMRLRRVPPVKIVLPLIKANKAGIGRFRQSAGSTFPGRRQRRPGHRCLDCGTTGRNSLAV